MDALARGEIFFFVCLLEPYWLPRDDLRIAAPHGHPQRLVHGFRLREPLTRASHEVQMAVGQFRGIDVVPLLARSASMI